MITEFQRLKEQEAKSNNSEWNIRRTLVKAQYKTHTDAVKDYLISETLPQHQQNWIYASEADILNVIMFGQTAKQWRESNPELDGNIRDYATIEQLVVLSSIESQNALLIEQGRSQKERLVLLRTLASKQIASLLNSPTIKKLFDQQLLDN